MEFKVGDHVKIIHDETFCGISYEGRFGTIVEVDAEDIKGYPYLVGMDNVPVPYWVGCNDIEKVEDAA